jgi:hypothetical protein
MLARERHGACLSRSDRGAPLVAHTWAAWCRPSAGSRRECGRDREGVPASQRLRRTFGGHTWAARLWPSAGAAGEGGRYQ